MLLNFKPVDKDYKAIKDNNMHYIVYYYANVEFHRDKCNICERVIIGAHVHGVSALLLSWNCLNRFKTIMRTVFLHGAAITIIYSDIQRIVTQESHFPAESRNEKSIFVHRKSSFCSHVVRVACATSLQFNSMLMDLPRGIIPFMCEN